jgi:hypothetical protein
MLTNLEIAAVLPSLLVLLGNIVFLVRIWLRGE